MCARMTDADNSDCIYRLMKDPWSYKDCWDEVFVICERCFSGVIMGGPCGALGDLVAAYIRGDWREMIVISRSMR